MEKRVTNRILFSLLFTIILLQGAGAQRLENSLLWKIEGKNIQPSYLFGTFHMLSGKDFVMKKKVSDAFNKTEQLVLELKMDNPLLQLEMLKYVAMKDSMTIDQLVDSVDYRLLDQALKESVGMGIVMFNTFKPMMIGSMLILKYIDGEPSSFDMTLAAMAKEKDMPVFGLETLKYQMNIFDEIPYEEQVKDLMEMVKEEEKMTRMFEKMVSVYIKEDINGLHALTLEDAASEKEIEMLLNKRNREWVSKIENLAAEKPAFIGVGAAHLGGEKGLVILLRKAGYTVTAVY